MTEAIVCGSLVRIAEHLVGLRSLLEFLLSLLVARITVRMMFQSHLSIGPLDLLRGGVPVDAQNFVVIPFGHIIPMYDVFNSKG